MDRVKHQVGMDQFLEITPEALPLHNDSPALERLLGSMLEISNFVGSVMMLDDILARIVRITCRMMQVPVCSIYLFDEERRLVLRSNVGLEAEMIGNAHFKFGEGIPGWVAEHGQIVATPDASRESRYKPLPSSLELELRAYLCVPLRIQEDIIGVMTARRTDWYEFTSNEILYFETVGKQVAIVIEKARMYDEKLQADRLATVAVSLSGVAHYIKNVLMTMQGGEYMVEQGLGEGNLETARAGWDVLRRANRKLRGLVENILNYCRQHELKFRELDLGELLNELREAVDETAQERGAKIEFDHDPSIGLVECDQDALYDALLNLVTNSLDAIPHDRPGRIAVRSRRLDGRNQYVLEVSDNGAGIPEESRERIFNLFFSTKGQKGTGIGLAATRRIVEGHGGTIELESKINQGSTFRIYMPITPPSKLPEIG